MTQDCKHHYVRDMEHVRHRACQLCDDVQYEGDDGVWRSVTPTEEPRAELYHPGKPVLAAREARGWTREVLAQRSGVSIQTIGRLENGSPGTSVGNLTAVLLALDMDIQVTTRDIAAGTPPRHPLNLDSDLVDRTVQAAASAACRELDALFPGVKPEAGGITSNFAGLLADHIRAMLEGQQQADRRHRTQLPVLGYSRASFGQEIPLPRGADGWLVQVAGHNQFLEPSNSYRGLEASAYRRMSGITDLYSSWDAAARRALQAITDLGHPEAPLEILPGCWAGDEHVTVWREQ